MTSQANESAEAPETDEGEGENARSATTFGVGYLPCCGGAGCVTCLGEACP